MFPGDSFSLVLVLFLLQDQLDEELLQFLVAVVDAKLFKAAAGQNKGQFHKVPRSVRNTRVFMPFEPVVLEYLKAVDVQHPDHRVLAVDPGVVVLHLDDVVDAAHDPAEQTLVHGLGAR